MRYKKSRKLLYGKKQSVFTVLYRLYNYYEASSHIMRYGISKVVLGFRGFIEIDEAEYTLIKNARENLFEALFLEEKFDLVTENFYEYETELLSIASRMMIFRDEDHFSMSREKNLVGRRLEKKNRLFVNLHKSYASNEIRINDA